MFVVNEMVEYAVYYDTVAVNILCIGIYISFLLMEKGRSAFKMLTGKPTGKRPLGRPRRRWEDNIIMDLEDIGINAGNSVDSAQEAVL